MNDTIEQRIDSAWKHIELTKNKVAKHDLRKMFKAVDNIGVELNRESVECRRLKKPTSRYRDLEIQINKLLTNLEQHITLAALLG